LFEPKQRAQSPLLAAGLASELKIDAIPCGRRFPVACCGELQKISKWSENKNGLLYIICISLTLKAFLFMSDSVVNKDGLLYISVAQKLITGHFKEGLSIYPMLRQ